MSSTGGARRRPQWTVAQRVDPNAANLLRRPFLAILVLAGVGGALDADDYLTYGVFTANQAGNMVLLWIKLLDAPGQALLSLSSLIGCALGIGFVVFLRSREWWFVGNRGSRTLLLVSAGVLAITSFVGGRLFDSRVELSTSQLALGSSDWWGAFASISLSLLPWRPGNGLHLGRTAQDRDHRRDGPVPGCSPLRGGKHLLQGPRVSAKVAVFDRIPHRVEHRGHARRVDASGSTIRHLDRGGRRPVGSCFRSQTRP